MLGTLNMLGLAKRTRARLLLTSTSEIYGDPNIHPQPESYWGNVNCIGPRACYDEGKRIGETLCYEYRKLGVSVRVARIFNTFGPRMDPDDGRVVSNFIKQALRGEPLTIYGEGGQTRSFQFVADLLQGLLALMNCEAIDEIQSKGGEILPVNLGNPDEYTIRMFAEKIQVSFSCCRHSVLVARSARGQGTAGLQCAMPRGSAFVRDHARLLSLVGGSLLPSLLVARCLSSRAGHGQPSLAHRQAARHAGRPQAAQARHRARMGGAVLAPTRARGCGSGDHDPLLQARAWICHRRRWTCAGYLGGR